MHKLEQIRGDETGSTKKDAGLVGDSGASRDGIRPCGSGRDRDVGRLIATASSTRRRGWHISRPGRRRRVSLRRHPSAIGRRRGRGRMRLGRNPGTVGRWRRRRGGVSISDAFMHTFGGCDSSSDRSGDG